ncbi:MAG: hypothetical protein ACREVP_02050 [Burkholderiales bacterium]
MVKHRLGIIGLGMALKRRAPSLKDLQARVGRSSSASAAPVR